MKNYLKIGLSIRISDASGDVGKHAGELIGDKIATVHMDEKDLLPKG
jgi:hypothetical protein